VRTIIIILDGVGIGHAPDAAEYSDFGAATLQHVAEKMGGILLKNMWRLGLANIYPIEGMSRNMKPEGAYGNMIEKSAGKDSTSGHWELAGLVVEKPFPVYPDGFPNDVIEPFVDAIGRKVLYNKPASGTEIIVKLGEEHIKTGYPIVYTSADSVFQIAAHEDVVELDKLYEWCMIAREILHGEHAVARVIARPFTGEAPDFKRTPNRHDFSLPPYGKTMFDIAKESGYPVVAIGKIFDLYTGKGITEHISTDCNTTGIEVIKNQIERELDGILMANLVDFDMLYGHRRNTVGFAGALREFDNSLPKIMDLLRDDDILFITADHGNDPTHSGTDHTRERVPIMIYGKKINAVGIGDRETFADLAATVCQYLEIDATKYGESFLNDILI